jgi:hypothetical protein
MWKIVFISPCKIAVNCFNMPLQDATFIIFHAVCSAIETHAQRAFPTVRPKYFPASVYAMHTECLNGNIRAP